MLKARKTLLMGVASAAAMLMVAAGCSSSKSTGSSTATTAGGGGSSASTSGGGGGSSGGGGGTYKVGVLTDLTGPGASTEIDTPRGVKTGVGLAGTQGFHIQYVVADTGTSPAGALSAAQKLVSQDHVYAVLAASALTVAAAPFLASKGIPVVGADVDATEWLTLKNMFSIYGYTDFNKVYTTIGDYLKLGGGTILGTVGLSIAPASTKSTKGSAISAQHAGLKVGYLNANLPFGTTNVGPVVLGMKAAKVDAFNAALDQTTTFAILKGLKEQGVNLKVALLPTGYGGDLTKAGPATEQVAQGVSFQTPYEPVEVNTTATQTFVNALKTYAGVTSLPTFGDYVGYLSVDGFVAGLKKLQAAGNTKPSQADFINSTLGITDYTGSGLLPSGTPGLYDSHTISFALSDRGKEQGADNCIWASKFSGSSFTPVPGADPICGQIIPGVTVSGSS